jgi:TPR repeat protein
MYEKGLGVAQDYNHAIQCFLLAANQDYAPAEGALAAIFDLGLGVEPDKEKAYFWASVASRWEGQENKQRLALLQSEVSPEVLAKMDERIANFSKTNGDPGLPAH